MVSSGCSGIRAQDENDPLVVLWMVISMGERQDMKGPLMATCYALKYIKDNRIPCKNCGLVLGCDEERTMDEMRYYLDKANEPSSLLPLTVNSIPMGEGH